MSSTFNPAAWRPRVLLGARSDALRRIASAAAFTAAVAGLVGCVSVQHASTSPAHPSLAAKHFASALVAEPILLRAGYTHLTQLFAIKEAGEQWDVALGFVRSDQALSSQPEAVGISDVCWTDSPIENAKIKRICTNSSRGFNLRWDLLREDGTTAASRTHDNLLELGRGGYSESTLTRFLSGFADQSPGRYRVRITVLRDAKELDFLKPHVLVAPPLFAHQQRPRAMRGFKPSSCFRSAASDAEKDSKTASHDIVAPALI